MQSNCRFALVNRQGGVIVGFSWGSIKIQDETSNKYYSSEEPFIIVCTASNAKFRAEYNLIGNIDGLFTQFINQGRATVCFKEPSFNIIITYADPDELAAFIVYLKQHLPVDSPVHDSMTALKPPIRRGNLYFDCQEEYKSKMKNIIRMNTNLYYFTDLKIADCTLELAGYQLPIADAIRKMKNLSTLHLERIKLCSSTFLEIESKELKRLHLCWCKVQLQISSMFKNDLCYKDSLVELHLEGNRWSEVPSSIFQFQNLLKLSLSENRISQLPDKFTSLPKLQELDLSHNRLKCLPPSIFALQSLLKLSLNNNLNSELPNIFNNLSKLKVLLLSCNRLRSLPPSIFEFRNLSELSLDSNRVTELPDMFAKLSNLQVLSLSNNRLEHLPPSIFKMQNLSELYLDSNLITDLPNMLVNLPKLETLFFGDNQLGYVPPSIFEIQNLSLLLLNDNHITELPDKFTNLSKLTKLSLSGNRLRHVPPSIFALQNLCEIDLSGNSISDLPDMIANLPPLNTLMLSNNQLRYVPSIIFKMQNLSELDLSRNYITELPDKFTNLSKLKELSLFSNQLTHLPPSIFALHLRELEIANNAFNFKNVPPSVDSELIVHSLQELSYRAILKHKLIFKEGMLPEKFLEVLTKYQQCVCGCKYVNEGHDLLFSIDLNDISNFTYYNRSLRAPVRGKMCTSLKSCFLDRFTNYK